MSDAAVVSSATPPAAASDVLTGLSPAARQEWRLTGNLPSPTDGESDAPGIGSTSEAASTPAAPADQAASTDAINTPASEPGTPKKANAETRIKELLTQVKDLQTQLALRADPPPARPAPTPDVPAASSPATETLDQVIQSPNPNRSLLSETQFFETYKDATVADFARYIARYEIARERQTFTATQDRHARWTGYKERIQSALTADPEFWAKQHPSVRALKTLDDLGPTEQPTPMHYAGQEILLSDKPAEVMAHLTAHPDQLDRLARGSWVDAIRVIAGIRATLDLPSVPLPANAGAPVSLAPPPPATLGKKPAQPADELSDAIRNGDFGKYRELQNRKDLRTA